MRPPGGRLCAAPESPVGCHAPLGGRCGSRGPRHTRDTRHGASLPDLSSPTRQFRSSGGVTGLNSRTSGLFLRTSFVAVVCLLHRCGTALGHTFGHTALMRSSVAAPRQLSRGFNSMVPGQASNHPVEPADHRVNRVLLLSLLSGCVPDVSLPTCEAGCPRREEIQRRPVA
jgi:hypothetical protein